MELAEALKTTGFEKCEFEPDNDPCEKCNTPNLQMYYRRTDCWEQEGDYYCSKCVITHAEEIASITEIECFQCGGKFQGWPHEEGSKCFDCFSDTPPPTGAGEL